MGRIPAFAALLLLPSIASAHVTLTFPQPRTLSQKTQVCGSTNNTRANVTVLPPGATITVTWLETIDHPGHYRVAFDDDGQDFPVPPTADTDTTGTPTVIQDKIADVQGGMPAGGRPYSLEITLPNIECNNCTLQLTQLMTDKPPYTTDALSNDIYYQCADITLSATAPDAGPPPGNDGGTPGGNDAGNPATGDEVGGGCCSTGSDTNSWSLLVLGAVITLALRRRRR